MELVPFKIQPVRVWKTSILLLLLFALWFYGYALYVADCPFWQILPFWFCIGFQFWQLIGYMHTIWYSTPIPPQLDATYQPHVDIFITVAGEPVDVVRTTATAAQQIQYTNKTIYVLNDGFVAKKSNWQEIEQLCASLGIQCITRKTPGGAKAGNVNHALTLTKGQFVAIFDADHAPHPSFLTKTMSYFRDTDHLAFVQTPQFYGNNAKNIVTSGSWMQQTLFFGPICAGKNNYNAAFMCGTNMVLRRRAIEEVGGLFEHNVTEDFLTSIFLHERGWSSIYIPEVLSSGLAPEDLLSYNKQQFRWARGSLEVVFRYNPLFRKGLSWPQRLQYLSSATHWLSGWVILINAISPLLYFFGFTGLPSGAAALLLPFIAWNVWILLESSNYKFGFLGFCFSMGSFPTHIRALLHLCSFRCAKFEITPKKWQSSLCWALILPLSLYAVLSLWGAYASAQQGISIGWCINVAWAVFYTTIFIPVLMSAFATAE